MAVRFGTPGIIFQEEIESAQKCVARFVRGNYNYAIGSMTGILGRLKWESLKKGSKDNRLTSILLYKGLKGKASIPTGDLISKTRRGRNLHSLALLIQMFIVRHASTSSYSLHVAAGQLAPIRQSYFID